MIQQGQCDCIIIAGESVGTSVRAFYCNSIVFIQLPREGRPSSFAHTTRAQANTVRTITMWCMACNHCSNQALLEDPQVTKMPRNMQIQMHNMQKNMQKKMQKICKKYAPPPLPPLFHCFVSSLSLNPSGRRRPRGVGITAGSTLNGEAWRNEFGCKKLCK